VRAAHGMLDYVRMILLVFPRNFEYLDECGSCKPGYLLVFADFNGFLCKSHFIWHLLFLFPGNYPTRPDMILDLF
jgi:hypothetical protein